MRTMTWMMALCVVGATACGGGGTGGGGGQGAGGGGTTTSTTMTSTTTTSTSTTTSTATTVNGCDPSTAEDHTSENPMMLMFGGSLGDTYSPKCAKIKAGSGVMFMGDLSAHPLAGGADGTLDASSPIKETKTGMMVEFDNLAAGTYGYFCENHDALGMHGAIFVE